MSPAVTEGKKKRPQAVSNADGVIAALTIDRQSRTRKPFSNGDRLWAWSGPCGKNRGY
jgi:hypothetical protein